MNGNGNGPNGNGDELLSAPIRPFHFTYYDSAAAFVRSGGSGPNGNGDRQVYQCSESFISPSHTPALLPLSSWRSLVAAGGGKYGGTFVFLQSSVKEDSYPELSAQHTAEVGGFGLYLVSLHVWSLSLP